MMNEYAKELREKIIKVLEKEIPDGHLDKKHYERVADNIIEVILPKQTQDLMDVFQAKPIGYGATTQEYEPGMTKEEISIINKSVYKDHGSYEYKIDTNGVMIICLCKYKGYLLCDTSTGYDYAKQMHDEHIRYKFEEALSDARREKQAAPLHSQKTESD